MYVNGEIGGQIEGGPLKSLSARVIFRKNRRFREFAVQ